jgi:hypothetical protein
VVDYKIVTYGGECADNSALSKPSGIPN